MNENINFRIIKNDLKRNKAGNLAFLMFIFLASTLISVSVLIVCELMSSITGMYEKSMPPHFAQIHLGEVEDVLKLEQYMEGYEGLTDYQEQTLINLYSDDITVISGNGEQKMSDLRLDVSLVRQNEKFDYLLDDEGRIANVNPGEIGYPVILLDYYPVQVGDKVRIKLGDIEKEFLVSTFVHDGAMNSTFASSTRMLVSFEDFNEFAACKDTTETLIEARFIDQNMAAEFQSSYENEGLPQNGQAITYAAIFLLSAMTDIMIAFVLLFAGFILIFIACLCVKYTIMASLEEEILEIGTMKAIGLSHRDIKNIYLGKYLILLSAGSIAGYVFSILLAKFFTAHIVRTFGTGNNDALIRILPFAACLFVLIINVLYCTHILNKMKKVTIVNALVTGEGFQGKRERKRIRIEHTRIKDMNAALSIDDTFVNFRNYSIVFFVTLLAVIVMEIPMNLVSTFKSEDYMPYLGRTMTDIVLDFQVSNDKEEKYEKVVKLLENDSDLEEVSIFERKRLAIENGDENYNLHVECGKGAGEGIHYISGRKPENDEEIAISFNNAKELEKQVGDVIVTADENNRQEFTICGIYQDITSGGLTAKSLNPFSDSLTEQYMLGIKLKDGIDPAKKAEEYRNALGFGYEAEPVREFVIQIFGSVLTQLELASRLLMVFGLLIIILVIVLFLKLRTVKDIAEIAGLKVIGFDKRDIQLQYLYRIEIIVFMAVVAAGLTFKPIGENVVAFAFRIAGVGITKMVFFGNAFISYLAVPALVIVIVGAVTLFCTKGVKDVNIAAIINE